MRNVLMGYPNVVLEEKGVCGSAVTLSFSWVVQREAKIVEEVGRWLVCMLYKSLSRVA